MPTRDNSEKNQHKSCFPFWSRIEPAIFLFFVLKDPSLAVGCLYPIGHQENNIYARFLHHHAKAFHHIPLQSLILTML